MFIKLFLAFSLYLNVIKSQPLEDHDHPSKPGIPLTKLATGQYYFEKSITANFEETTDFCKSLGLDALSIESEKENNELAAVISKFSNLPFWTSGVSTENGWSWNAIKKPIKYTSWAAGQPDNKNTKYYLSGIAIYYDTDLKQLVWDDQRIEKYAYVICELNK